MEFVYLAFNDSDAWKNTIKYNVQPHKEFMRSNWHINHGWWSMYGHDFRRFLIEDVLGDSINEFDLLKKVKVPVFKLVEDTNRKEA
jgi:hypothetical protein